MKDLAEELNGGKTELRWENCLEDCLAESKHTQQGCQGAPIFHFLNTEG